MKHDEPELVHLICGSTGSGKTTFAQALASEINGVSFSIDQWMVALFGDDAPAGLDPAWITPRVARCEAQIWTMALKLGSLGIRSVLDLGFQRHEHRQKYATLIKKAQFQAKLHVLDVDPSVRWARVQTRNEGQGTNFQMEITRGMFDYIETIWEKPSGSEIKQWADT